MGATFVIFWSALLFVILFLICKVFKMIAAICEALSGEDFDDLIDNWKESAMLISLLAIIVAAIIVIIILIITYIYHGVVTDTLGNIIGGLAFIALCLIIIGCLIFRFSDFILNILLIIYDAFVKFAELMNTIAGWCEDGYMFFLKKIEKNTIGEKDDRDTK